MPSVQEASPRPATPRPATFPARSLIVGVDAHTDTLTAALLDPALRLVQTVTLPNTEAGYLALLDTCEAAKQTSDVPEVCFAVENVKAHALPLALFLIARDHVVYDLPPAQVATLRTRRVQGKSDAKDAQHAALLLATTREQRTAIKLDAARLELQTLERTRASLVSDRVAYEARLAALDHNAHHSLEAKAALQAVLDALNAQLKLLDTKLRALVKPFENLTEEVGVGIVCAAVLLGEVLDMARFPSEAAFASYCGVAPRDSSSGRSQRVRVNPGGNRRLNAVIEIVTRVRLAHHEQTRRYYDKKLTEGQAPRQAFRATKRQVCKALFKALCSS